MRFTAAGDSSGFWLKTQINAWVSSSRFIFGLTDECPHDVVGQGIEIFSHPNLTLPDTLTEIARAVIMVRRAPVWPPVYRLCQ